MLYRRALCLDMYIRVNKSLVPWWKKFMEKMNVENDGYLCTSCLLYEEENYENGMNLKNLIIIEKHKNCSSWRREIVDHPPIIELR